MMGDSLENWAAMAENWIATQDVQLVDYGAHSLEIIDQLRELNKVAFQRMIDLGFYLRA